MLKKDNESQVLVPEVMALPYGVETSRLGVMDFHDLCCFVSSIRLGARR